MARFALQPAVSFLGVAVLLLAAVALGTASMLASALLQRRILAAGGARVPVSTMVAVTYASNAISVSVPLAGSAAGTAFTYQQLKRRGAGGALASWTVAVSGVFSIAALATVIGGATALRSGAIAAFVAAGSVVLGAAPVVLVLAAPRWPATLAVAERELARVHHLWSRATRRSEARTKPDTPGGPGPLARFVAYRMSIGAALHSSGLALVNWTADILCLAACLHAVGASVPWSQLAFVYAAGLGAATLSWTPAGLGIVEAALAMTLVGAGVPARLAVPAAIAYRAVSCWLPIALGWMSFAAMRSGTSRARTC
jgi:putative heme transporter